MSEALLRWLAATATHGWKPDRGGVPRTTTAVANTVSFNPSLVLGDLMKKWLDRSKKREVIGNLGKEELISLHDLCYQSLESMEVRNEDLIAIMDLCIERRDESFQDIRDYKWEVLAIASIPWTANSARKYNPWLTYGNI